jgi:hypothetical protein
MNLVYVTQVKVWLIHIFVINVAKNKPLMDMYTLTKGTSLCHWWTQNISKDGRSSAKYTTTNRSF